jgi:putative inorganic carbon (HCO3(-)) transporter
MLKRLTDYLPASLNAWQDRTAFLIMAGSVALGLVSIAASQILLFSAVVAAVWLCMQRGKKFFRWPPAARPLLAFCLWTLFTIYVSPDMHTALGERKKFFLYLLVFLVPMLVRGRGTAAWVYCAIFAIAPLSSCKGLWQFISNPHRDWLHRISGYMSHVQTYSGLLMLTLVALSAFVVCFGWRKHKWVVPLGLLIIGPLILSQTRNAWLGAVVGIVVVMALHKRPRALALLLVVILAVYFLSPPIVKKRLQSGFDSDDPNTRNRIELFETALRLMRSNPWSGVGPKNVAHEALRFRGSHEWPDWMYQHMHNNFLQIAAERGIPGLLIWLWFMGRLAWDAFRVFRSARSLSSTRPNGENEALMISTAALGAWAALLAAGMLEYNFGDSEVLALFLFMMSVPCSFLNNSHCGEMERAEHNSLPSASLR